MIVPSSIMIILVGGHEAWRRICPLAFVSQLANSVGWQRRQKVSNSKTTTRYEPVKISKGSWLARYALTIQFCLLFVGLNIRLLFTNSDPILLGIYLILTLLAAIIVGYLYGGKTWCHYFCPMAPVQVVFTGPRGLLGSKAHLLQPPAVTQSMCRTTDETGVEKSACVGCKQTCFDIDAEQAYWDKIHQSDRKLVYYGYVGLVLGFFLYFPLYSGNWYFQTNGTWTETNQLQTLFNPGLYLFNLAVPIPKLVAVPLTLSAFTSTTYCLGLLLETVYKRYGKQFNLYQNLDHAQSQVFTVCTFLAFNLFVALGIYPSLNLMDATAKAYLSFILNLVISIWVYRTAYRKPEQYIRECLSTNLRRQLKKLNLGEIKVFAQRSLEDLSPDEVYIMAKSFPDLTHENHLQIYKNCLEDILANSSRTSHDIEVLKTMRKHLEIDDEEHQMILNQLDINTLGLVKAESCYVSEWNEFPNIGVR
jgi:hypothetical protein